MIRPDENYKKLARTIASQILADARAENFSWFSKNENGDATHPGLKPPRRATAGVAAKPQIVGIWEPRKEAAGVAFVRTLSKLGEWGWWADIERIEPKGRKLRIVLLGESAARGSYYDPWITPALVLEHMLRHSIGTDEIEVVDLARYGISKNSLQEVTEAAILLEPDAMIVLAGNNWHVPTVSSRLSYERVASMLRRQFRWEQIQTLIEENLREQAGDYLDMLAEIQRTHGIPVVFLLPEFNLGDWKNEEFEQVPLRTALELAQSRATRKSIKVAIESGDPETAARLLDGEPHWAHGFELMAQYWLQNGKTEEARKLAEKARDANLFIPLSRVSRCYATVSEKIREKAHSLEIALVDLPKRFMEYLPDGLPDRRLFLDHCHLRMTGIKVAMASAAEAVHSLLNKSSKSWRDILADPVPEDPRVLAEAHLAAALHCANCEQPLEILKFHCEEAVRLWPDVIQTILLFLDAYVRRAPLVMSSAFEKLLDRPNFAWVAYLSTYEPSRGRCLRVDLVEAMLQVVETKQPTARKEVISTLRKEHGIDDRDVDLLDRSYAIGHFGQATYEWQANYTFYIAYIPESRFPFTAASDRCAEFTLCYRVPGATEAPVTVYVNNEMVSTLIPSRDWRTSTCRAHVHAGSNEIIILWPELPSPDGSKCKSVCEQLELGPIQGTNYGIPGLFVSYGEIHLLRVHGRTEQQAPDEEGTCDIAHAAHTRAKV